MRLTHGDISAKIPSKIRKSKIEKSENIERNQKKYAAKP